LNIVELISPIISSGKSLYVNFNVTIIPGITGIVIRIKPIIYRNYPSNGKITCFGMKGEPIIQRDNAQNKTPKNSKNCIFLIFFVIIIISGCKIM